MGGYIIQRSSGSGAGGGYQSRGDTIVCFLGDEEDDNLPVYDTYDIIPHATDSLYCRPLDSFPSTSVIVVLEHSTTVSG